MSATLVSLCREWLSLAGSEFDASIKALSAVTHEPDRHEAAEIDVWRAATNLVVVVETTCVNGSVLDLDEVGQTVEPKLERVTGLDPVFSSVRNTVEPLLRNRWLYPTVRRKRVSGSGSDERPSHNLLLREDFQTAISAPSFQTVLNAIGPHGIGASALAESLHVRVEAVWLMLDMYRDNLPDGPVGALPWRRDALFRAVRRPGIPDDIVELGHLGFALLFHIRFKEAHAPA